jgi:hypothetical protein
MAINDDGVSNPATGPEPSKYRNPGGAGSRGAKGAAEEAGLERSQAYSIKIRMAFDGLSLRFRFRDAAKGFSETPHRLRKVPVTEVT